MSSPSVSTPFWAWGPTATPAQGWTVTLTSRRPSRWCGLSARAWCRRRHSTSSSMWPSPSSLKLPRRSWRSCRWVQQGLVGRWGVVGLAICCWDHGPSTPPLPTVPEGPGVRVREHHLPPSHEECPCQGLPHLLQVSDPCLPPPCSCPSLLPAWPSTGAAVREAWVQVPAWLLLPV